MFNTLLVSILLFYFYLYHVSALGKISLGKTKPIVPKTICGVINNISGLSGKTRSASEAQDKCWHVALHNSNGDYFCSGALIGTQWVLISAYCLGRLTEKEEFFVGLGNNALPDSSLTLKSIKIPQHFTVDTVYIHPDYNKYEYHNIALIKLQGEVKLESHVCLACLPESGVSVNYGKSCSVTWTNYKELNTSVTNKDPVTVIEDKQCVDYMTNSTRKKSTLPPNSFCAGENNNNSLLWGNAGAPLICGDESGIIEVVGVGGTGNVFASQSIPAVFTQVSSYINWIYKILANEALVLGIKRI